MEILVVIVIVALLLAIFKKKQPCKHCGGSGTAYHIGDVRKGATGRSSRCEYCKGRGWR